MRFSVITGMTAGVWVLFAASLVALTQSGWVGRVLNGSSTRLGPPLETPVRSATAAFVTPQVLGAHAAPSGGAAPPTPAGAARGTAGASRPSYVGVFVSEAPGEPAGVAELSAVAALGCNIVYNYRAIDGTPAEITRYLDRAAAVGVRVIVGLDSLWGAADEGRAVDVVRAVQSHPAVWGFGISDEKPEGPDDVSRDVPLVRARYVALKAVTAKPLLSIAVGWVEPGNERRAFLANFAGLGDAVAVDQYPIPYFAPHGIAALMRDLPGSVEHWFIPQAFSWSSYPETARGLGYDLAKARLPTEAEMAAMGRQALSAGAAGVLYYSYFDIKSSPQQLDALKRTIAYLRS